MIDLKKELVFYGAYHSNTGNVVIHVIFVPLILFTAQAMLSQVALMEGTVGDFLPEALHVIPCLSQLQLTLGLAVTAFYTAYYLLLEPVLSIVVAPTLVAGMCLAQQVATMDNAMSICAFLHILSWVLQVQVGHVMLEKRKPALMDSFMQSFVTAPLFVALEVAFFFGYRRELQREVDAEVKKIHQRWREESAKAD
ncbi:MAG: hypothetical protein MHM6MM_002688 [Cercozoa sp. M6MM]